MSKIATKEDTLQRARSLLQRNLGLIRFFKSGAQMKQATPLKNQIARTFGKALPWLMVLNCAAFAKSGVEGAQLDYVALDASVECNRILFQSSQHFKRTLFMIPRVVQGTGLEGGRIYSIQRGSTPNTYILSVNIYFPANDEVLKSTGASSIKRDLMRCNMDEVKHSVNKNITDPNERIQTISRIPLTAIEMRIPGIAAVGMIDRSQTNEDQVDILDYYGKTLTLHFQITEQERENFESQLVQANGITSLVKYKFQARSREGSVHVKVDMEKLIQEFSAAANLKGLKFLASADVAMFLKNSLTQKSIQITTESGIKEDISKVAQVVIEKVLSEVSFSSGNDSEKSDETKSKDKENSKAKAASPDKGGLVAVSAVLDILKTKVDSEFRYNSIAAPETATAQTNVKLSTDRINDPNVAEIELKAGYTDPYSGISLNAGYTMSIIPASWYMEDVSYSEKTVTYLSEVDLKTLKLGAHFPDLLSRNMTVQNVDINGTLLAEGVWQPYPSGPNFLLNRHRWVREQVTVVNRSKTSSDLFDTNLETVRSLPVYVTFSELGGTRLFQLADLLKPNSYFHARYDELTGKIFLTALRNLGSLRFRHRLRGDENVLSKNIVLDRVLQERKKITGSSEYIKSVELKSDPRAIIKQKTIILHLSRPEVTSPAQLKKMRAASGSLE